ncbi:hypothetical protein PLESTB_001429400 [Pleodorina starrii]|uniref:Uncharacterized protein n=1 Tax=Pleodorina starrii TaxID=330485 RepID=A0A9W6BVH7_9CHLO|nr:hypothetical protein PLESTM_001388800 [Pleodorina starrii]GLC58982.1 hypothetical protein PLESTB_001429400 [Pleodorina starrii]
MEALEYNVLRQKAYNAPAALLQPSMEEMQQWVTDLSDRRRSLQLESSELGGASFRELEQRYHLQDVWGHNTTPAMQVSVLSGGSVSLAIAAPASALRDLQPILGKDD